MTEPTPGTVHKPAAPLVLAPRAQALPGHVDLWRATGGPVDVFVETARGPRRVLRLDDDDLLVGAGSITGRLTVAGTDGARLVPAHREQADPDQISACVDRWITAVAELLSPDAVPPPDSRPMVAGEPCALAPGERAHAAGRPVWIGLARGESVNVAGVRRVVEGPVVIPVAGGLWVESPTGATLQARATRRLGDAVTIVRAARALNRRLAALVEAAVVRDDDGDQARVVRADAAANQRLAESVGTLARASAGVLAPVDRPLPPAGAAVAIAAASLGVPVDAARLTGSGDALEDVPRLARRAGVRVRRVVLPAGWWRTDVGPLIAARSDGERPMVLLPYAGKYRVVEPTQGQPRRLDHAEAEALGDIAYAVYRTLPPAAGGGARLARFVLDAARGDLRTALWSGAAVGLFGVLIPVATAFVIDDLVPGAERQLLVAVGAALAVAALVSFVLAMVSEVALVRIDGRGRIALQIALWDRLLRLPAGFYRGFSAGDLARRLEGGEAVREVVVRTVVDGAMVLAFSSFSVILLFVYAPPMAFVAIALAVVYAAATLICGITELRYRRQAAVIDGELAGTVIEFLQGVNKLRTAGAERRAFARWAGRYAAERRSGVLAGRIRNHFIAVESAWPLLSLLALFAAGAWLMPEAPSAGVFIAFLAAFATFQGAFAGFARAGLELVSVWPQWERLRPVLDAAPERGEDRADVTALRGRVDVTGLSFAYDRTGQRVLDDVDLHVEAGRCIALVGPSGSGKSTVLRVLLGFEEPLAGSVLYDGQDVRHLDLDQLRRHVGAVLQTSRVFAGSVLDNVRGAEDIDDAACLSAAEAAGLADDVAAWPMGLHTPLTEGGDTLSGGQRQRVLIARALAARPRILLLDEATSALDNETQARVVETFDRLGATRIVVAHRLSTVRGADRIYFMDAGRVEEAGTYDELMALGGRFARFAARQLA